MYNKSWWFRSLTCQLSQRASSPVQILTGLALDPVPSWAVMNSLHFSLFPCYLRKPAMLCKLEICKLKTFLFVYKEREIPLHKNGNGLILDITLT